MNKTLISIVATSFLLVAAPFVAAEDPDPNEDEQLSEQYPECEEGQRFVGYSPAGDSAGDALAPYGFACEGEHWDGQDPMRNESSSEDAFACGNTDYLNTDPAAAREQHTSWCQERDPNTGGADPTAGKPVSFRVSTTGSGNDQKAYVALHIGAVGQVVVYADKNSDNMTSAVYLRDSTFPNALATVVSSAGITKGYVDEKDCDHKTYSEGAAANDRTKCGRDNTAVTALVYLP